jgi:hypothetical protein
MDEDEGKFYVGRTVFDGKVNYFVNHNKLRGEEKGYNEAVVTWRGRLTPHMHISPYRTIWDRILRLTFEQECRDAYSSISAWCDWANDLVEQEKLIEEELNSILFKMDAEDEITRRVRRGG